jgi:large subunit ribosomal protein L10
MPSAEKVHKVAELKERIEGSEALLVTDFEGLTVGDATELRRTLRGAGARFAIVKNTLMRRAASDAGAPEMEGMLSGPTGVAFVDGDVAAVAKSLSEAAKRFPRLALKGAFMEGRVLSADEAKALADLEPRPVLLSKVAGLLKSEMTRAASMLQTIQGRFLALLESYKEELPDEAAAEPEPEAAEPGAAEPEAAEPGAAEPEPEPEAAEPEPEAAEPEPAEPAEGTIETTTDGEPEAAPAGEDGKE